MIVAIFDELGAGFRPGVMQQTLSYYYSVGDVRKTVILGPEVCRVEDGKAVNNADCVCKTSPDLFLKIWNDGYFFAGNEGLSCRFHKVQQPLGAHGLSRRLRKAEVVQPAPLFF